MFSSVWFSSRLGKLPPAWGPIVEPAQLLQRSGDHGVHLVAHCHVGLAGEGAHAESCTQVLCLALGLVEPALRDHHVGARLGQRRAIADTLASQCAGSRKRKPPPRRGRSAS